MVEMTSISYLRSATEVHGATTAFVVQHRPTALSALSSAMSSDEKRLIAAGALAPSPQLKNDTLSFAKAVGVVSADLLKLTKPKVVPTATMVKITANDMKRVTALGNWVVADGAAWEKING
jgi:hypothetical protein